MKITTFCLTLYTFFNTPVNTSIIFQNATSPCELPNYCLNNGSCVDETVKLFACLCKPGFTGNRCELEVNDCYITSHNSTRSLVLTGRNHTDSTTSEPLVIEKAVETILDALGGGLNNLLNFSDEGFSGSNFSENLFRNSSFDTNSRSSIRNLNGLETSISVPVCENGAQCVDKKKGFECRCAPGFVGETCQVGK